jgi:hypothetical protein
VVAVSLLTTQLSNHRCTTSGHFDFIFNSLKFGITTDAGSSVHVQSSVIYSYVITFVHVFLYFTCCIGLHVYHAAPHHNKTSLDVYGATFTTSAFLSYEFRAAFIQKYGCIYVGFHNTLTAFGDKNHIGCRSVVTAYIASQIDNHISARAKSVIVCTVATSVSNTQSGLVHQL